MMARGWKLPALAIIIIIVGSYLLLSNTGLNGKQASATGYSTFSVQNVAVGDKFVDQGVTYTVTKVYDPDKFFGKGEHIQLNGNIDATYHAVGSDITYDLGDQGDYISLSGATYTPKATTPTTPTIISSDTSMTDEQTDTTDETDIPTGLDNAFTVSREAWANDYKNMKMGTKDPYYDSTYNGKKVYVIVDAADLPVSYYMDGVGPLSPDQYKKYRDDNPITEKATDTDETDKGAAIKTTTQSGQNKIPEPITLTTVNDPNLHITVKSDYNSNSRTADIKITGTDKKTYSMTYTNDGKYMIDKDQYVLLDSCKIQNQKTACFHNLNRNNQDIPISKDEYDKLDKMKDYIGKDLDAYCAEQPDNKFCPDTMKKNDNYISSLMQYTDSALSQVLTAYLDELLGPFSYQWPYEAFCNDKIDKGDTDYENRIHGIPVPHSDWQSQLEDDIYNNIRTAVVFGDVEQITDKMYRYDVTVKLVGDMAAPKWQVYLVNSCTGDNSTAVWEDHGALAFKQVYEMLYAGGTDQDMIFECGKDPVCRFDYVYLKFDDEKQPRKFKLAGSDTITDLCG